MALDTKLFNEKEYEVEVNRKLIISPMVDVKLISSTIIIFMILSVTCALSLSPKDYHSWVLIVDITKYNAPEIAITDFKDSLNEKLKNVLIEVAGFPENQIILLKDKQCTFDGIKSALARLSQRIEQNDRFILYFRGCVAKPWSVKPAYLLAYDTPANDMSKAISETLLGKWLSKIKAQDRILIMDYYTFRSDARQYTINREIIGTSSLNIFQPLDTKNDYFGEKMVEALKLSETDKDSNRKVNVRELYEYITRESGLYLSPIGNLDATFIELPSMLQIQSIPSEAYVSVNGEKLGLTPQRIINELKPQSYEIKVHKRGYLPPNKQVVRIRKLRGESANLMFKLVPIRIYGKVKIKSGEELPDNVKVEIKDYAVSVDNEGNYSFDDWDKHDLEVGEKYKLIAKSSDLYYGSAEFLLNGKENIHQDIELHRRGWYEVAQIRFDQAQTKSSQQDYTVAVKRAVQAFQTGVEENPDFTKVSPDFADTLYRYFRKATTLAPNNLNYIIATAKLAEQLGLKNEAERYWQKVKDKSATGSSSHKLAVQHLKELAPYKGLIRFLLIVLLVLTLISGGYLIYRHVRR